MSITEPLWESIVQFSIGGGMSFYILIHAQKCKGEKTQMSLWGNFIIRLRSLMPYSLIILFNQFVE